LIQIKGLLTSEWYYARHAIEAGEQKMSDFLREFTDAVGAELEAANRGIASACHDWGKVGGLLTCPRECNYQYLAWRAALSLCYAEMEQQGQDLLLLAPPHSACIEMKTWLSASGLKERSGIREDLDKLQRCALPDTAFMLFSSNDLGQMPIQLDFLRAHLFADIPSIWGKGPLTSCFPTASKWQPHAEFWVAVWPVKIGPMFSGQRSQSEGALPAPAYSWA